VRSALALFVPAGGRTIWSGGILPGVGCHATSLARNSVPGGRTVVATRTSSFGATASLSGRCGSAWRQTKTTTPREVKKRKVRIVLAGIAAYCAKEVLNINTTAAALAIATP